ncbi:Hypothetical predicted protein [Paramuricea clavata]|uniref:Uncharacterized protein n=1 Tax=Paramuricea clavata TaxID=317549 RepID=A0A6S7JF20_PARCT|nr:Hypothetical predicted protein [Paramuricea clavata]
MEIEMTKCWKYMLGLTEWVLHPVVKTIKEQITQVDPHPIHNAVHLVSVRTST